jgi:hypothetical protein
MAAMEGKRRATERGKLSDSAVKVAKERAHRVAGSVTGKVHESSDGKG